MAKMALKQGGFAVNVVQTEALATSFHPDLAALFEAVPDDVEQGWRESEDGTWTAPALPPPAAPHAPPASAFVIDIPTFKMRFTPDQLDAIRASDDATVKAFLREIVDDPRTTNVNLALPYVQGALMLLASLDLIGSDDVAAILAPVTP